MTPSQSQSPRFPDCTNSQRHAQTFGQTQCLVDIADPTLADQTVGHSSRGGVPFQDPFTYYKAFLNTESPSTSRSNVLDRHDEGDTQSEFRPDFQSTPGQGGQQNRQWPVPYNIAVRFANRSNGAPLATIIEQGSVSTLNSHGSLLSVGRFPSIRAVENASPGRASHRPSRSLDDNALDRIQEEKQHEHASSHNAHSGTHTKEGPGGKSEPYHARATPAGSILPVDQNSQNPQLPKPNLGVESKDLRGFFRCFLTKRRSSTRSRSRSFSGTDRSILSIPDTWSDVSPPIRVGNKRALKVDQQGSIRSASASTTLLRSPSSSPHHATGPQVIDCSSPEVNTKPPTAVPASALNLSRSALVLTTTPSLPQVSHLPNLSHLQNGKELSSSICSVSPEPRYAALDHVHHTATTVLSRSRDELAARYTPDGVVVHRNEKQPLRDYARNSSRNASFCSTMSTSYSGTVLGIDLDLQHEFPHSTRRSVTPVWFSPKEPVVKAPGPPKRELHLEGAKPIRPRSITSSALTSLLPIAAAEGIVQHNTTTPQLSFYSPSGNLIQAQDMSGTPTPTSSSRSRLNSHFLGTPATSTSYYNGPSLPSAHLALSAAASLPPVRPALVPFTTPPQSTALLPEHLRHHHNYRHAEKSQIRSMIDSGPTRPCDVVITSESKVRGCDGVIRPTSLNPHSGIRKFPYKHSKIGHSVSCLSVNEEDRWKSRFLPFWPAPTAASRPKVEDITATKFRTKGKTLRKRQRPLRTGMTPEQRDIGPAAGHVLRVCFCQPYDGMGQQTGEVDCSGAATMQKRECQNKACAHQIDTDPRETATPNARVVIGGKGKGNDKGKGKDEEQQCQ